MKKTTCSKFLDSGLTKALCYFLSFALIFEHIPASAYCSPYNAKERASKVSPYKAKEIITRVSPLIKNSAASDPLPALAPSMNLFGALQSFRGDPFSGAAVNSIPIVLPPARMKSAISLNLTYNSSAKNDVCGAGWDLSVPCIQRQVKNGVPSYGATDIFGISQGGSFKELIQVSPGIYQFKIEEDFWKIQFASNYWVCTDKAGTVYRFGYNPDSREQGGAGVFKWCLDRITDIHGNYCAISYTENMGMVYPSQVRYTGNDSTQLPPETEVNFIWQDRPDISYSYITGKRVSLAKRISGIEIRQDSSLVRKYNFSYVQSPATNRSLLESIVVMGSDGSSSLPPIKFKYSGQAGKWGSDDARWHSPNEGFLDSQDKYNGRQLIDLNGDAWPDFVIARNSASKPWYRATHLNGPTGFSSAPNWKPIPLGYFIYDYWDDGRRVLDLTRDGKPEEIAASLWDSYSSPGSYKNAYRHTGIDWVQDTSWNLPDDNFFVYGNRVDGGCRFGDLNGDGYTDLIISRSDIPWNNRPLDSVKGINSAYINTGSGWKRDSRWDLPDGVFVGKGSNFQCTDEGRRLIDVNGDGLSDLLIAKAGYKAVYLNTGSGWVKDNSWNIPDGDFTDDYGRDQGRWLSDINGDGFVDLLVAKDGYKATYLNTGIGWNKDNSWNVPEDFVDSQFKDTGARLADLDGDSVGDLILSRGSTSRAFLNLAGFPDLLTGISNSLGAATTITYKSSAYYNNKGVDDIQDLPFCVQTVSKVVMEDGMGNKYTTTYSYFGGMYDGPTREFRGFGHVWVYDEDGNNVETIFYQDELRNSKPYYEKYFDSGGKIYQQKLYNWKIKNLASGAKFTYLENLDSYVYGDSQAEYKQTQVFNVYDDYGNPVKIINYGDVRDGTDDKAAYTEYNYNYNSWLLSQPKHTYIEDYQKNKVSEKWFYYDDQASLDAAPSKGLLTKAEVWLNTAGKRIAATYGYDGYGNLILKTDALSHIATITYDALYHQFPVQTGNHLGYIQSYTYDAGTGQLLTSTDTNGYTSRNVYDVFGRLKESYGPNDDANHAGIRYEYDLSSAPIKTTSFVREEHNTDNPDKIRKALSFYDGSGRLIQTKTESEDPAKMVVSDIVTFNSRGQVKDKYFPYFAAASNSYQTPDYTKPKASFEYDPLGRIKKTIGLNESGQAISSTVDYYLFTKTMTGAGGNKIKHYYDGNGQLIKVEEFNGGAVYTTRYLYDTLGNLIRTIDNQANAVVITYDSLGRKTSMNDPDMGIWNYQYDDLGDLIKQTDAKGNVIEFEYDALNRLVKKKTGNIILAAYTYDETGKANCKGRLSKITDQSGSTEFFYDNLGREVKSMKTVDGTPYAVERSYDALNRLVSLKYPDGEVLNYTYNKTGAIEKIAGARTYVSNVNYNYSGQIEKVDYGNNTHTDYVYSPYTMRLQQIRCNDGTLQDLAYQFDNSGNVSKITDNRYTATQSFAYDGLSRLISATGNYGAKTYRYDSIGNMIEKEGVTFSYGVGNVRPHAATSGSDGFAASYDANGNMITRKDKAFNYDIENRLTKVIESSNQSSGSVNFNITLKPGWNFISLPMIPGNNKISSLLSQLTFGSDYDQVSRYNPFKSDFDNYNNTSYNQFDTLEYGRGYLIHITRQTDVMITLTGQLPASAQNMPLKSGWNLIGASLPREAAVSEVLNNLREGVDYNRIARYNKTTQVFENLSAGSILKPGESYYLYCLKDVTWVIQVPAPFTEFIYDGDGGRVKKIAPDSSVTYIGSLFEKDSSGKTRKYIYLGQNRIASVESTGSQYYYHEDHLGSSSVVTDSQGQLAQHLEYLPYGKVNVSTGTDIAKHKFTGKELDNTGLYFYGARYYDPEIGRFITADPTIQRPFDPQDLNRYSYCRNNPINYTDPSGLGWGKFWKKASGFVGAAVGLVLGVINPYLGMLAYSAIAASGQGGNFGKNFGINFASGLVGYGIGAGINSYFGGGFLSGLTGAAFSGAGAGAAASAMLGGDVGTGAFAGLAGGAIGYAGGFVWPLGADAIGGGVAAEIMGGKFGEGAAQGAYYNMAETIGGILAPMSSLGEQNPQPGDVAFLKADSPVGLGISLFEGGPFSHVGIVTDKGLASTNFGKNSGYEDLGQYSNRSAYVSTRYRGSQSVINAATAMANVIPKIQYGFFPGQKVCSTITAAALNNAGYGGWYGIGPNSQQKMIRMYGEN
ncbi:MAG: toxin TcdB middle/N-terminal domain-containing protein [Candidatus Omnitrophota bacterium]|nr:toxin TcdB middle/N-terminal domain-containing protein [Candidatus Omnitrophota bacterium]